MQIFYYYNETPANFYELGDCLVAAVNWANTHKLSVDIYQLTEYEDGRQENVRLATIQHGGLM